MKKWIHWKGKLEKVRKTSWIITKNFFKLFYLIHNRHLPNQLQFLVVGQQNDYMLSKMHRLSFHHTAQWSSYRPFHHTAQCTVRKFHFTLVQNIGKIMKIWVYYSLGVPKKITVPNWNNRPIAKITVPKKSYRPKKK